jgi:hypothetical protein
MGTNENSKVAWSDIASTVPQQDSTLGELVVPDTLTMRITGRSMEPAFPHGSHVFIKKNRLPFIRVGTPVVIETTSGHRLCKLWGYTSNENVFLGSLNTGPDAYESIALLKSEIKTIWLVLGCWFDGLLLRTHGKDDSAREAHDPPKETSDERPTKPADAAQKSTKSAASKNSA